MSRIIVAYTVAGLTLFGALFAAMALSGVLKPGPTPEQISSAGAEEAAAAVAPPVVTSPTDFTPPTLEPNRQYRISHETPIYSTPAHDNENMEHLPAGGFFIFNQALEQPAGPWYEITVGDGTNNLTRYLFGPDLRWKVVTPQYSGQEVDQLKMDLAFQQWKDMQATRVQERMAAAAAAAAETPAEPETLTFDEWWALKGEQLGGTTTANLVASGVLAAIVTVFILGSLAMLTVLRREHAWSRPVLHDEYEEEPEDLAQAKAGPAGDHLYEDDEDVPKLEDRFRI